MKRIFVIIISLLITFNLNAQIGGNGVFDFLNLTNSSRIAALGGDFLSINDDDITLALSNPSLINENMHNHLALNYVEHFTDINYGFATYSRTLKDVGSFAASIQYVNYGKFTSADPTGVTYGTFTANEMAMNVGWSKQLQERWFIGANIKGLFSQFEQYNSSGVAVDVAGTYYNKETNFCSSLIIKNIGRQIKPYVEGNIEPIPFEIQVGMSKKLKHAPFRFSILADHLEKFDLNYDDPTNPTSTINPLTGEALPERKFLVIGEKVIRHFVIGSEMLLGKNLSVRFGYNFRKRQEMIVDTRMGMVGFSWGSKFNISYARAAYHITGAPNVITITTNFSDFYKND